MSERKANPAAVALGKLRWKGKSEAEKRAHSQAMLDARWHKGRKTDDLAVQEPTKGNAK